MIENRNKKLGEMLVDYGMITDQQLKKVLKLHKEGNKRIGQILIENNLANQDQINWVLGKQLNIPYIHIELEQIDQELLKDFPEYLLKNYSLIPVIEINDTLVVAMADPTDDEAIQKLKNYYKKEIDIALASFQNIAEVIQSITVMHGEMQKK